MNTKPKKSLLLIVVLVCFVFMVVAVGAMVGYGQGYKQGISKGKNLGVCLDRVMNQSPKNFDFLSGDCPNQVYKMRQILEPDEHECYVRFSQ